jgi:hypothetical protein
MISILLRLIAIFTRSYDLKAFSWLTTRSRISERRFI